MARSRLLIVSLITGACLFGMPLPSHAGPRFPDTLERSLEIAKGLKLRASATTGVFAEPASRKLPIRANLIAVSFRTDAADPSRAEDGITVEARYHSAHGWTDWDEIPIEAGEAPDASSEEGRRASDRVFTQPTWVGLADHIAVRLVAHAGAPLAYDVRVHAINSMGNATPPSIVERVTGAVSRLLRGNQAEALTATPSIITRHGWGADESWREKDCCPRYAPRVYMAFVHHTAGTNSYSRSESPAIVRGIYRFHTKTRHYSDIAYNFLIDRYGQIFEGRYGGMDRTVVGAHVAGFNTGSTGISLMGTFTSSSPTSAMITSLKRLLAWKMDVHHIPAVGSVVMTSGGSPRFPAGRRVRLQRISGHSDGGQTACPGKMTYRLLPSIRNSVSAMGWPKIYLPGITSSLLRPNGDSANETSTVTATISQSAAWVVEFRTNSGTVLKTITGTGTAVSAKWDGKDAGGDLADSGVVRYTITARASGRIARAADGAIYMVNKHPDGTVLTTPTQKVVIEDGKARPIPSQLVFNSWYRNGELVGTTDVEVARYPSGAPLKIREGTLLAEPGGTYSMFSGGERRPFASGVYAALGYTAASALPIDATELAGLPTGPDINDPARHPPGAVVKAPDGSIWTIGNSDRSLNSTTLVWRSRYRDAEVVPALALDVALSVGTPVTYRDGTLFRLADGTYWIFDEGQRRRFYHPSLYSGMGYQSVGAMALGTSEANSIPQGPLIV